MKIQHLQSECKGGFVSASRFYIKTSGQQRISMHHKQLKKRERICLELENKDGSYYNNNKCCDEAGAVGDYVKYLKKIMRGRENDRERFRGP